MVNQNPEQIARDEIDKRLIASGWVVQDRKKLDWTAGLGIAVREYPTEVGPADYILFVDQDPVGVIEAKKDDEGFKLTSHEEQTGDYANSKLKHIDNKPLPFRYESTGVLTRYTDIRDPKPRSRHIFSFHRPESLQLYLKNDKSFRERLHDLPKLIEEDLRDCQINAILNLEKSLKEFRPRALVQMATGSGKTFTAITACYRLLKFSKAKRILFLVDTKNLGEQAEQEFMGFTPNDDNRKFTELYNVTRLKSKFVPEDSQIYISTIQRLYSALKGEDLEESLEETNPYEMNSLKKKPADVVYNEKISMEFFDVIIVDECHRSIYNLWKQVLDYFDSFLVGLTATPDKRTFAFFNENVVSEYSHTKAVADGVNVGFDTYVIETEITKGITKINAKEFVDKRDRLTRRKRWEQVDEEVQYTHKQLDKDVVNPSQIRNIIKTFRAKLPEIFPERKEIPKTLIFAKTDSHADDIIQIVREEFGEGNDFCKKVTYQAKEDPKTILSSFRNEYNPRIAVTVDMIATGTDVKPLECLLFMRDVKSKNYYEQMLGRGTRTYGEDDLKKVTPSAKSAKTHFVVIDAIGVTKSHKTDARPLEKKPSVPMKELLHAVMMGSKDEEVYSSLAGRLSRLSKQINETETDKIKELAKGHNINDLINALMDAHDPDKIEDIARTKYSLPDGKAPSEKQSEDVQNELIKTARSLFSGELNTYIDDVRKSLEQIIDTVNLDNVSFAGWDKSQRNQNATIVEEFKRYIFENKNEITALKIIFNQPHHRKDITYSMIKELYEALKLAKPNLAPLRIYAAYSELETTKGGNPKSELTAIVSLIRKVSGLDEVLTDYSYLVDKNFQDWVFKKQAGSTKFTKAQMEWLHMIKEHISTSFHIEKEDLDYAPFDAKGGMAKMYDIFGPMMDTVINEINEALVA